MKGGGTDLTGETTAVFTLRCRVKARRRSHGSLYAEYNKEQLDRNIKNKQKFNAILLNTCLFTCWFNSAKANQKASRNIQMQHKHTKLNTKQEKYKKAAHTKTRYSSGLSLAAPYAR